MTRTAVATLQTIWDCRWSRPGDRIAVQDQRQPEPTWVCVKNGRREPVTERQCETCERWEQNTAPMN